MVAGSLKRTIAVIMADPPEVGRSCGYAATGSLKADILLPPDEAFHPVMLTLDDASTSVQMRAGEPSRSARLSRALTHPKVVETMMLLPSIMNSIYWEGLHGSARIWVADREDHRIADATS